MRPFLRLAPLISPSLSVPELLVASGFGGSDSGPDTPSSRSQLHRGRQTDPLEAPVTMGTRGRPAVLVGMGPRRGMLVRDRSLRWSASAGMASEEAACPRRQWRMQQAVAPAQP